MREEVISKRAFRFRSLRALNFDDVEMMLDWMHDPAVASVFQVDFMAQDASDVKRFIMDSWSDSHSLHCAITNAETDHYLGTISLKHIDRSNSSAEYAIVVHPSAQGSGVALSATEDVLAYAFDVMGLNRVYLDVRSDNERAIAFYDKVGFSREGVARQALRDRDGRFVDLIWLSMIVQDYRIREQAKDVQS